MTAAPSLTDPDRLSARGLTAHQDGRLDEAIADFRRATELAPGRADHWSNLGKALRDKGENTAAIAALRQALAIAPDTIDADYALGAALFTAREHQEALACFERVAADLPDFAEVHNSRGLAFNALGRQDEALEAFERALACDSGFTIALANRVAILSDQRRYDEALALLAEAGDRWRERSELVVKQIQMLRLANRTAEAGAAARSYLARQNEDNPEGGESPAQTRRAAAAVRTELAGVMLEYEQIDAADAEIDAVLADYPDMAAAHNVKGNVLRRQGYPRAAIEAYRRALAIEPQASLYRSSLVFVMQFADGVTWQEILADNRRWADIHEAPILRHAAPLPPPVPLEGRKLRVGYVSPYFRGHVATCFLLPLLAHHDRERVEITCYADLDKPDAYTERYQALGHEWRDISGQSDADVAQRIREDRIDVLVDTALYMAGSRLPVYAHRAAPVQVSWLGYPGTTGLTAMDYRLTDPWLDPPGAHDERYAERSLHLDHTFWCYAPMDPTPEVTPPPALKRGYVTFGCLNNFGKVTEPTLILWGGAMARVPNSRLLLLCPEGRHRQHVLEVLGRFDIAPDRVHFIQRLKPDAYFRIYREIDLCLDPIPYNGHTTTLDSLWMGVPVVSVIGPTIVGRAGHSILTNLGMPELVADRPGRFATIVEHLVQDLDALAELRQGLRARLAASPLMDAAGFARNMERVLEDAYCETVRDRG